METWFILIFSVGIAAIIMINSLFFSHTKKKLPHGPFAVPIIGNLMWLTKSFCEIEPTLRGFMFKYGPIISLKMGSCTSIFISSHSLAHRTLVQNGAIFSDRPKPPPTGQITTSNQHNISSASYGPTWRLFRRNLTTEILHPSRIKSYSQARLWVLDVLLRRLYHPESTTAPVKVIDHLLYAMFYLLLLMCFGDKLHEDQINQIVKSQRRMLLSFARYNMPNILNIFPRLGKILFRKKWKEFMEMREEQERVLRPLIESRISYNQQNRKDNEEDNKGVEAYVDTLLDLQLPKGDDQKRKLTEGELVTLCSEFLNAGTDTTSTALQWILANMVKYPEIQSNLYKEITEVMGPSPPPPPRRSGEEMGIELRVVKEEDMQKMPYLKAVVLEGLRRHPPSHFLLPHSVSEEVVMEGYVVPKNATINFMVADLGWDPKVWKDPMKFKPERFIIMNKDDVFDITGNREIKMMPFGAGRRICPALGLSMLHLEYFVANLVWYHEWKGVEGEEVDLSEKQEFTTVMKNPLKAHISPRG
ncbi:hypothetical protein LguiB_020570 [Lonicera macranthoides]